MKKYFFYIFVFLFLLFWMPFLYFKFTFSDAIYTHIEELPTSDAAIIFGALVKNNEISPLQKERLEAGKKIFENKKVQYIVVSNMEVATNKMSEYLENTGIHSHDIQKDIQAYTTIDTCKYEKENYDEKRKVIFVSQSFHLPRILYQCKKVGIEGIGFAAESIEIDNAPTYSIPTTIYTRIKRNAREAALDWLALLQIYN